MTEFDITLRDALRVLRSDDLAERIRAVEEIAEVAQALADEVVKLMIDEPDGRYLVFERLGRFGSLVIAPLERALSEPADDDALFLVRAALVASGSSTGRTEMLEAVSADHPNRVVAVNVLAKARVTEAIGRIEDALRTCDLSDDKTLMLLVGALDRLDTPMPDDIRERLQTVEPAWLRDGLLRSPSVS